MTRFWLVNLIDKIFVTVAVFLIIFAWINFYINNLWTTFLLSLIFSFAIVFLLYYFLGKKQEKVNFSKQEIDEMNKCFLAFRLMNRADQQNLIKKLLIEEKRCNETDILIKNKKLFYKDELGNHLIIIATNTPKIDDNEFINLINEYYENKFDCYEIICNECYVLNKNILKDKKITFITQKDLYKRLKASNLCPNTEFLNLSSTKFKFKDIAKSMFLPSKAKSYFLCGLILIFSSIILPFNFYYIIIGSMLMLFAIICKILPKSLS